MAPSDSSMLGVRPVLASQAAEEAEDRARYDLDVVLDDAQKPTARAE